jgi:hypothetical protein
MTRRDSEAAGNAPVRRAVVAVSMVALVASVAACSSGAASRLVDVPVPPTTFPVSAGIARYRPSPPVLDSAAPARLTIPAIGVSTDLVPLGLNPDGSMQVPAKWGQAGWYTGGPRPGEAGPAVIAGHVDSVSGPAVFFRLHDLDAGDVVAVTRADGSVVRFVVDRLQQFPKRSFPTAAVFAPTPGPELRLITCTGAFDETRHSYLDNLVAFASPAT